MKDVDKLVKEADANLADQAALADKLTEEEDTDKKAVIQAALDEKMVDWDGLKGRIEQAKSTLARQALLASLKAETKTVQPDFDLGKVAPKPKDHIGNEQKKHDLFLDYICGKSLDLFSGEERKLLAPKSERFQEGDMARSVALPDNIKDRIFGPQVRKLFRNEQVTDHYAGVPYGEGKTLPLTSIQATGEAVIPQDFRATLLQGPTEEPRVMARATVVPAPTGLVVWPRLVQTKASEYGGVVAQWISEAAEKPATEPEIEQVEIRTHEAAAHTKISHNLLNRSVIDLDTLVAQLFRDSILNLVDTAFMVGSGIGQPLGVVNTAGINTVTRQAANQVGYTDLVNLEHAVLAHHRAGATWTQHDTVVQALKFLLDLNQRPLWIPNALTGISAATPGTILGREYLTTYRMNTIGNSGDIAFGNWRYYVVALEEDVTIKASDHYNFLHNVRTYVVYLKVGGRLVQPHTWSILGEVES